MQISSLSRFAKPEFRSSKKNIRMFERKNLVKISFMILLILPEISNSQIDSTQQKLTESLDLISNKAFRVIDNKYSVLQNLVERKTERMLNQMQKKEAVLQRRMESKDSIK